MGGSGIDAGLSSRESWITLRRSRILSWELFLVQAFLDQPFEIGEGVFGPRRGWPFQAPFHATVRSGGLGCSGSRRRLGRRRMACSSFWAAEWELGFELQEACFKFPIWGP